MEALADEPPRYFLARVTPSAEKPDVTDFVLLQPRLSEEQWHTAQQAIGTLSDLYRGFNIHLRIAFDDFEEEVAAFTGMLAAQQHPDETSKMRIVNKALIFSVALRMYEEHVVSSVSRRWGKDSDEIASCKRSFSEVFDRSFAYRVVYALRNALVHSEVDLVTLNWSMALKDPDDSDSGVDTQVRVGLSRERFAMTDTRAVTRREVAALSADPDLLELSRDVLMEVEQLNVELEPIAYPDVEEATLFLWELTKEHFPDQQIAPVLVSLKDGAKPDLDGMLPIRPVFWDYIVRRGGHALAQRGSAT